LARVPNSRLILLAPQGSSRNRVLNRFARAGIDANRIEFVARQPRLAYLETFHRIDISLDTVPYNGHTTSLDSFWMGVPVVTLIGKTVVGRAGWCLSCNLNLRDLAADSEAQFVEIAVELAGDLPRLTALRSELRRRMQTSPLMNGKKFAAGVEQAYRQMWERLIEQILSIKQDSRGTS
jgi:predicted O-linked N-acetylglucosamine transferase (SPINDLY family)